MADEVATAGSDAAGEREEAVRTKSGTCRRDIVARIRREVEAELARVRATARLVEQDRIGPAGYLALLLAIGVNVYGFVTYGDR